MEALPHMAVQQNSITQHPCAAITMQHLHASSCVGCSANLHRSGITSIGNRVCVKSFMNTTTGWWLSRSVPCALLARAQVSPLCTAGPCTHAQSYDAAQRIEEGMPHTEQKGDAAQRTGWGATHSEQGACTG